MASAQASQPSSSGPLSFMGCMREASPPPFDEQAHRYHHQHYQQSGRPHGLPTAGAPDYLALQHHDFDSMPKEPKKRRFHPLRGLRRIFRKKSRGAADSRPMESEANADPLCALAMRHDREEITLRDPAGRPEDIRSRSASELLTDSCDRDRLFLRRRGLEESFLHLQRNSAQLSVSHDSVFPGEVGHARALSSLDSQPSSLERRTGKTSNHSTIQHKEPSQASQKHRISLRVLEQIKTVIENRNQIAASSTTTTTTTATTTTSTTTTPTTTETTNSPHNRFSSRDKSSSSAASASTTAATANAAEDSQAKVPRKDAPTPSSTSLTECSPGSPLKEDLPEPTSGGGGAGQLSHTAALHRISVRPKNRRPPRRSHSNGTFTSNAPPRIESISENSIDTLDSLEEADSGLAVDSPPSTPQHEPSKPIPIVRKSSSRLSRNSDVFEELEAKLPTLRRAAAVSPDSLESNLDEGTCEGVCEEACEEAREDELKTSLPKPSPRTASLGSGGSDTPNYDKSPRRRSSSNRLSKSPDSLESSSPGWLSKSSEGFDKLSDLEDARETGQSLVGRPVPARRLLLKPISKSQERVCYGKTAESLDEAVDDSAERRRSSFEIRSRSHNPVHKIMSKSTECFDSTLHEHRSFELAMIKAEEKPKRASVSELNLSKGAGPSARYARLLQLSKSSESFERVSPGLVGETRRENNVALETQPNLVDNCWRTPRRLAHSSESSDNLELEDNCRLENRNRARRSTPKRLGADGFADEQPADNAIARKSEGRRSQKSSESSELGSTDTLDSERRNTIKSSDSEETLDSLEKESLHDSRVQSHEETTDTIDERCEQSNEEAENENLASHWARRTNSQSDSRDSNNLDIHQLIAYSLVSRIQENGNNDNVHEDESISSTPVVVYPKKKLLQQQTHQQQSSSEENKTTFTSTISNLLSSKTNEDLQNMLNGNISEVSTDTKSFKEKLIMFEQLGK